eukprot:CAMPEP_0173193260 /NCGR_PEP_ID=MMETSP1141-20130122/13864_1 /TAXON_ID=483371 /ORGANISM="non described non described, Strain CCMP2298" /LENGTH=72 /DNA_ID=CAMNT_0014117585 /DNA_START=238 /DNA_END=456 /DNA_ORIENTATION=-
MQHLPEHHVAAVEPRRLSCGNEELGTVGVLASVGHTQHAQAHVLVCERFVFEAAPEYAFPARAIPTRKVSTL